jgi:hypothetical protein
MRMCLILKYGFIVFSLLPSTYAQTRNNIPQRGGIVFGSFSSFHSIPESGDVVGREVLVLPNKNSAYVVFQCAEGGVGEPVLAPAEVSGTNVSFKITQKDGFCNGTYVGSSTAKGMILRKSSERNSEFLLRKRSYWAQ